MQKRPFGRPCLLFMVLLTICVFPLQRTHAEEKERIWSVSPLLGLYSPSIDDINSGLFNSSLPVRGSIIFETDGSSSDFSFEIENTLPKIRYGTEAGLELQMALNNRDSVLFGIGTWEGVSTSVVQSSLPFQGVLSDVLYERSANLSYTQYFFGWRRDIIQRPKKYNIYTKLTLHEIFDIDYKENYVFAFQTGPAATFKRIITVEGQSTGILMFQLGMGGEIFLQEWLSLGLDGGYRFGIRKFKIGNATQNTDILGTDNFVPTVPLLRGNNTELLYLEEITNTGPQYQELEVSLDGWGMLFRVNIYY